MIAHQVLLGEPARALPVGAEIDWDAVVDDDGKGCADNRGWMSAAAVCAGHDVVQSRLHNHTGAVVFSELHQLFAEPISVANDCVNKVFSRLSLNRYHMLQTGEGVIPRR